MTVNTEGIFRLDVAAIEAAVVARISDRLAEELATDVKYHLETLRDDGQLARELSARVVEKMYDFDFAPILLKACKGHVAAVAEAHSKKRDFGGLSLAEAVQRNLKNLSSKPKTKRKLKPKRRKAQGGGR